MTYNPDNVTIEIFGLIKERDLVKICLRQVLGLPVNSCVTRFNLRNGRRYVDSTSKVNCGYLL